MIKYVHRNSAFTYAKTAVGLVPWAPATIPREPGQVRKEAATASDSCAGVWLMGPSPFQAPEMSAPLPHIFYLYTSIRD